MNVVLACFLALLILILVIIVIVKIYLVITCGRYYNCIGKQTVKELAKNGATVHVLARNLQKADRVIGEIKQSTGNYDIHIHRIDLNDFSTVRAFAKNFLSTQTPIHILINNAGLISNGKKYTKDGNEETTQANHLSHFLLTRLLLDRIIQSGPSRIINVSSYVHRIFNNSFHVHDINYKKSDRKWAPFEAYSHSKLMNVLFTRELDYLLYGNGVTVNAVHPGTVRTEFTRNMSWKSPLTIFIALIKPFFYKSEREGAATTLYLADSDQVEHVSGEYFADCKMAQMGFMAVNNRMAEELWEESERLTGLMKSYV